MTRSSDTWFTTNWWKRCLSIIGWRKSSGVLLQATRANKAEDKWTAHEKSFNESVMCWAGSNKGGPVMHFMQLLN